jgi:Family of unknown function (DUF6339)
MPETGKLCELGQSAAARLDLGFLTGEHAADVGDFVQPFAREVSLNAAKTVVSEARERNAAGSPAQSDRWLGPRFHAALRLTRREAARKGVWRYLGVVVFPDYVRWRFRGDKDNPDAPPKAERFIGPDNKQALARLWWMTELFRNGSDYTPAGMALSNQDIVNNLFRMGIVHHRPTALGAVEALFPADGQSRTGAEANALAKALNATASTVLLDAFARDDEFDGDARKRWMSEAADYDPALYLEKLPDGPDDPPAPSAGVEKIRRLCDDLLGEMKRDASEE